MKTLITSAFILCFAFPAFAGHGVGGGGIAENNILYTFSELESFIDLCLTVSDCGLTETETKWLAAIKKDLPSERKIEKLIEFRSEKKEPGFFILEGQQRIAKTGYVVGSVIYFNIDLLYSPAKLNFVPSITGALDIAQAASLLVHELGHHQGIQDHDALDILGSKIQKISRAQVRELDGGRDYKFFQIASFDYGNFSGSQLIAKDVDSYWVFGKSVMEKLPCGAVEKVTDWSVWNLHWLDKNPFQGKQRVRVEAFVDYSCAGSANQTRTLRLLFPMANKKKTLLFKGPPEVQVLE